MSKKMRRMESVFLILFMLVGLFTPLQTAQAGATDWTLVGSKGFSNGKALYVSTFVYNDTPYVAYQDYSLTQQVVVKKYNGSSWVTLGSEGLSAGGASYTSLYVYNGVPYVAYKDVYNSSKVTVKKYNAQNDSWDTLGVEGFSTDRVYYVSMFVASDGTPYVAYRDLAFTKQLVVKKYIENTNEWESVGHTSDGEGFSAGSVYGVSLYIEGTTPYALYSDNNISKKSVVEKYNAAIDSWEPIGNKGFSYGSISKPSLYVKDGIPYAVYMDGGQANNIIARKYDGSSWVTLGPNEGFAYGAGYPSLYMDNGILYAAYFSSTSIFKAVVKRYNERSNSWTTIGKEGFSDGNVAFTSLFAQNGTLYCAYQDSSSNSYKATMMKYTVPDTAGVPVASPSAGAVEKDTEVTLSTPTVDAIVYYTTDGSLPTAASTLYTGPITIDRDMTIKAFAVKEGVADSAILTVSYTAKLPAAVPTADPPAGEVPANTEVRLSTATDGASVHYTTDGSTPTTASTLYTDAVPIVINDDMTIKAITVKEGMTDSDVFSAAYTIKPEGYAAAPIASVPAGMVPANTEVGLSTATDGAYVYYTTDGSTPTAASALYVNPIKINTNMTIKAIAAKKRMYNSEIFTASYTIDKNETLGWKTVGKEGFSADYVTYSSLYIDNGIPYVAYRDCANSNKATVMKYDGNNWMPVGMAGFSEGSASNISFCVDNGTPYITYYDDILSSKAIVKKFDGSSWVTLGTECFTACATSKISLCAADGKPYVAYSDTNTGRSGKITVKEYDGSDWVTVGTTGFSEGDVGSVSLYIDNGTPYVAYEDASFGLDGKLAVKKYNGSSWVNLGLSSGISAGSTSYISLYVDNGTPYVAYRDGFNLDKIGDSGRSSVMKYDGTSDSWSYVGNQEFSTGHVEYVSLFVNEGIPYVAYKDYSEQYCPTVLEYNGSWIPLEETGFSSYAADYISLYVDNGIPYVAYQDYSEDVNGKATVMKYDILDAVEMPVSDVPAGEVKKNTEIEISTQTVGASVYYAAYADGSGPETLKWNLYDALHPIVIDADMTIKTYAKKDRMIDSDVLTLSYTVAPPAVAPTASIPAGEVKRNTEVTLSTETEEGAIHYTTDGSTPTDKSTLYVNPIKIDREMTIKAIAAADGLSDSDVLAADYYIFGLARMPIADPSGGAVEKGTEVTLGTETVTGSVYYAVYAAGSDPDTLTWNLYDDLHPIVINSDTTIKAYTIADKMSDSDVMTADYTIAPQVAVPTATPVEGAVTSGTTVTLSTITDGAYIYYTTNGDTPTETSILYTGPIKINSGITIKAIAVKDGMSDSEVMTATYRIKSRSSTGGGGGSTTDEEAITTDLGQATRSGNKATLWIDAQKAADLLKDAKQSALVVDLSKIITESVTEKVVQLPAEVVDLAKTENKPIEIRDSGLTIAIPPEALTQGKEMTFSTTQESSQTVSASQEQVENKAVYSFDASAGGTAVHNFNKAVIITLPIPDGVTNPEKLGVYYLNETSGQWEYVGGRIVDGKLVFTTNHFSKYMVAESTKTFGDIASHWAKNDIEIMVARNVINGLDTNTFAPQNNITRAEFAALLSRVLKLTDAAENTFKDVTGSEWYASDVNKAAKAGIILGSDGNFRPGDRITRQEMAAMIQRAYIYAGGKVDTLKDLAFTDKDSISSWANDAVRSVYSLGIIKGRINGSFGAIDNATRAEGTVMLKTLMDKLGL